MSNAAGQGSAHGGHGTATAPYEPVFTDDRLAKLKLLFTKYPTKQACLLPALWIVQEARGWISELAIGEVAEILDLTPAYVKGVVTFYTMYHQHPVGRYFVQVCTTSPCAACGAEDVVRAFLEHTGTLELGVTSPDGSLAGIVTDGDLRRYLTSGRSAKTIDEVMTQSPLTAAPDTLAAAVLRTMNERKITQMFVLDQGKPVGLIHMHDLLKAGVA